MDAVRTSAFFMLLSALVAAPQARAAGDYAGNASAETLLKTTASWDGKPIGKLNMLLSSLGPDSVGKLLAIQLRRGGQSYQTKLQIGERPAA